MGDQIQLITTGVAGLDAALGGGITPGALTIITGPPGAGKTVLGSQIVFTAARHGMPTLIFTAYSEGHDKFVQHLQSFTFFEPTLLGTMVRFLSINSLIADGLDAAATVLVRTIRESGARVALIDGLQGVGHMHENDAIRRRFLSTLSSQLAYVGSTVFVTVTGDPGATEMIPTLTAADTIISLSYTVDGLYHMRHLNVVKQRGRAQLPGLHAYRIIANGLQVFPRLEAYPEPASRPRPEGRARFGLPELDQLLGGGLTAGTTTTLAGAPGTGKTTLAIHWAMQDAHPDAASVLLGFRERPEQLIAKAAMFGMSLSGALQSGALHLLRIPPVELNPDDLADRLLKLFGSSTVRRLVIDDVAFLMRALGTRGRDYSAALVEHFYGEGTTTLCTLEIDPFEGFRLNLANHPLAVLAENLIVLQQQESGGVVRRVLAVVRMRFSDHDRTLRTVEIGSQGIRVLTPTDAGRVTFQTAAEQAGGISLSSPSREDI